MTGRKALIVATVCALVVFSITLASASSLSVSSPAGLFQSSSVEPVRSDVRDRFNIGAAAPLQGQITDFHGGQSWGADEGPMWNTYTGGVASTDWVNESSNFLRRPVGGLSSTALVPYLVRESRVRIDMRQLSTTTVGGVMSGADPTGTTGLTAVGFWDGSTYRFGIVLFTSGTASLCSPLVDIGAAAGNRWRIEMTFAPASGGPAAATLVKAGGGGGSFSVTSTCSTVAASGSHAGIMSYSADNTRYDNFLARL
ncbi:MAG: hypothetical protein ACR2OH_09105 [Microthrixaceae bacterium]